MKLLWSEAAWEDYLYWQKADPDTLHRINALLQDIRRSPFKGLGKPEPLRGDLSGWWSRRISGDHRIVYRTLGLGVEQRVEIVACRYLIRPAGDSRAV
jgi:toxin YoeB